MTKNTKKQKYWGIGTKLTTLIFIIFVVLFVNIFLLLTNLLKNVVSDDAKENLTQQTTIISNFIGTVDETLEEQLENYAAIFRADFGTITRNNAEQNVVDGVSAPVLYNDDEPINLNFQVVDRLAQQIDGAATVFVRRGDDFIRISTSLKDQAGKRTIGTKLDPNSQSYKNILNNKPYVGTTDLFGKDYITRYDPILNSQNQIIGILFIGIDFTTAVNQIAKTIGDIVIGKTGSVYTISTLPQNKGVVNLPPAMEGINLLNDKNGQNRPYIQQVLEQKNGLIETLMFDESKQQEENKIVSFREIPKWNSIIIAEAFLHEFTEDAVDDIMSFLYATFVTIIIFGALLFYIMRRSLSIPLKEATIAANTLSNGDLNIHITTKRKDEIGQLLNAINGIGNGLSDVVSKVRHSAATIAQSSEEITRGNMDLSTRTESQASSLEETSASMHEITETVKKNTEQTDMAVSLIQNASSLATQGGDITKEVMNTMTMIQESSHKIVDIIAMINDIAFQTNILALNAAVEAARAGEQGRGFAVVATEVRTLAQRSSNAAKEIDLMIHNSVNKVEAGHELSIKTGTTMNEIVEAIQKVTAMMNDMQTASKDQTLSISQINIAVSQMDEMTQHNAALVEESAASAESLQNEAAELVDLVKVFKLKSDEHQAPPARSTKKHKASQQTK